MERDSPWGFSKPAQDPCEIIFHKAGGTHIWFEWMCAAQVLKLSPTFKCYFGRKKYLLLGLFFEKFTNSSKFSGVYYGNTTVGLSYENKPMFLGIFCGGKKNKTKQTKNSPIMQNIPEYLYTWKIPLLGPGHIGLHVRIFWRKKKPILHLTGLSHRSCVKIMQKLLTKLKE